MHNWWAPSPIDDSKAQRCEAVPTGKLFNDLMSGIPSRFVKWFT